MPLRTQTKIRRDINRLGDLVDEHATTMAPLRAIQPEVGAARSKVNSTWQAYRNAAITARKEIVERDSAVAQLNTWNRTWRSVVMIKIPGASESIHVLPASGATADDVVRVGNDLKELIETRAEAEPFREDALADLGTKLEDADRETKEATVAVPKKEKAADDYSQATLEANAVLVEASKAVRNIFGATSREYKQFIARASAAEDAEDDEDSNTGEDDDSTNEGGGGA